MVPIQGNVACARVVYFLSLSLPLFGHWDMNCMHILQMHFPGRTGIELID